MYARGHAPQVEHGRKTLQIHGFPMQTCGGHITNSASKKAILCPSLVAHRLGQEACPGF